MKFPKFIQDHSAMIPGAPEHRKTFKNLQIFPWEGLGASGKNLKKSSENIVLNDFLDVFFQIFPCWRMYCPCGGTRGPFFHWINDMHMTLGADTAQSNYRTCWIFAQYWMIVQPRPWVWTHFDITFMEFWKPIWNLRPPSCFSWKTTSNGLFKS